MSIKPQQYHCATCGCDYESTGHQYDERWILDTPHDCQLPYSRFFIRTEVEYEFKEGLLYTRTVTYRKYSGHDTGYESSMIAKTDWKTDGVRHRLSGKAEG